MRNVIWRTKYSLEALYQRANIAQSLQRNIRPLFASGLLYLTCQQQQETWEQITPSSLNQNVFYWLEKEERNDKFLKSTLTISGK